MRSPIFSKGAISAIVILYALSGLLLYQLVGPWEAVRQALVNGLILVLWLTIAHRMLRHVPPPDEESLHYPAAELLWLLLALGLAIAIAAARYADRFGLSRWLLPAMMIGMVTLLFVVPGYSLQRLGLRWPTRQAWLVGIWIILINFAAAGIFQLLPAGEAEPLAQADLANQFTGPSAVLVLIFSTLLGAALPEELLLRVALLPRLAHFMPVGWAIILQALLFSAAHLPQRLIGYHEPWLLAIGYLLAINNGVIGGYLWWRTRSLPLLLVLHLFAYPRIGI